MVDEDFDTVSMALFFACIDAEDLAYPAGRGSDGTGSRPVMVKVRWRPGPRKLTLMVHLQAGCGSRVSQGPEA